VESLSAGVKDGTVKVVESEMAKFRRRLQDSFASNNASINDLIAGVNDRLERPESANNVFEESIINALPSASAVSSACIEDVQSRSKGSEWTCLRTGYRRGLPDNIEVLCRST